MGVIGVDPIEVTLADEDSHLGELSEDDLAEHFQDHLGIGVFGRAGGKDILVTSTLYHVGGRVWSLAEAGIIHTNFILADPANRKMHNNEFVGNRFDPIAAANDFGIERRDGAVIWRIGDRQTICRPPHWEIKGEHLGVNVDIRLTAIGKALPYRGAWEKLAETKIAGNELLARAEGTVTYDGETHVLEDAWAVRERMCLGPGRDVISLLSNTPGYLWGWVFSDAFKMFCHAVGDTGKYAARVYVGDDITEFGPDETFIEALEHWTDPASNVTYPVRWRIEVRSDDATLNLETGVWSRCLFGFYQRHGFSLHMGALGRASGKYVSDVSGEILIDDVTAYFDQGKATPLGVG